MPDIGLSGTEGQKVQPGEVQCEIKGKWHGPWLVALPTEVRALDGMILVSSIC